MAFLAVRIRDEFQRTLLARSFCWASVITFALATVWGCVEMQAHGVVPHIPYLVIPGTTILLTTIAKLVIFRQNQAPAE